MRILVADDDALSRRLLEKTLERAGYDVISVPDGRLAAEHLCSPDGPRMALLDWMMPEVDGPAVCRKVRALREQPYVHMILLTSRESKADIVEGLESGADDYLVKPFNPEELKARLRTGVRILTLEDKLVEAREDMRFRATHDTLTGLLNRGFIMELLARGAARARREGSATSVLLADLDHFKSVNDTYGHPVGDAVLVETSRRLMKSVRAYDSVGRYGGEEFLLLMEGCEHSCGLRRAEQICKAIAEHPFETAAGFLNVTVSVGLLTIHDTVEHSIDHLLRCVDQALYEAKAAGRNCLRIAHLGPAPIEAGASGQMIGVRRR